MIIPRCNGCDFSYTNISNTHIARIASPTLIGGTQPCAGTIGCGIIRSSDGATRNAITVPIWGIVARVCHIASPIVIVVVIARIASPTLIGVGTQPCTGRIDCSIIRNSARNAITVLSWGIVACVCHIASPIVIVVVIARIASPTLIGGTQPCAGTIGCGIIRSSDGATRNAITVPIWGIVARVCHIASPIVIVVVIARIASPTLIGVGTQPCTGRIDCSIIRNSARNTITVPIWGIVARVCHTASPIVIVVVKARIASPTLIGVGTQPCTGRIGFGIIRNSARNAITIPIWGIVARVCHTASPIVIVVVKARIASPTLIGETQPCAGTIGCGIIRSSDGATRNAITVPIWGIVARVCHTASPIVIVVVKARIASPTLIGGTQPCAGSIRCGIIRSSDGATRNAITVPIWGIVARVCHTASPIVIVVVKARIASPTLIGETQPCAGTIGCGIIRSSDGATRNAITVPIWGIVARVCHTASPIVIVVVKARIASPTLIGETQPCAGTIGCGIIRSSDGATRNAITVPIWGIVARVCHTASPIVIVVVKARIASPTLIGETQPCAGTIGCGIIRSSDGATRNAITVPIWGIVARVCHTASPIVIVVVKALLDLQCGL